MSCRLKLDQRSDTNLPLMDRRFEEYGVRVAGNFRAQPAEMRAKPQPCGIVPMFRNLHVALLVQGTPDAPGKLAVCAPDRNLQTSSDVKTTALVTLYLALLPGERRPGSLIIGQQVPLDRSIRAKRNLIKVVLGSTSGAGKAHGLRPTQSAATPGHRCPTHRETNSRRGLTRLVGGDVDVQSHRLDAAIARHSSHTQ